MANFLGLDLGTSSLKALLVDERQNPVASATAPLSLNRPHAGWSEQNPDQWISAARKAIDELQRTHPTELSGIAGIGLSGQMHGATLLDDADRVLRPAILWNDTRSHLQATELDARPEFRNLTGNIVFPGFTAPKLAWVRENEPEIFRSTQSVLLPKDFLRLWLTGEKISDMSDASGTSWLDVGKREWSETLLAATDLPIGAMPTLVEGSEPAGEVRAELLSRWGLKTPVTVAGGAGDNAAAACGLGVVEDEMAFVSLGTSGVLFAANSTYRPAPESAVHCFCHAFADTWHQMGVILSATDSLNWFAKLVGQSPAQLTRELGNAAFGPGDVTFLPYLSGERTPHNETREMGAFIGLSHRDNQQSLTRAVLIGVAFALRDNLEALRLAGTSMTEVVAVGGGSQSKAWLQTISNALQIPVHRPMNGDYGAAFGAARLGLLATQKLSAQQVCLAPDTVETFEPDATMQQAYADAYQRHRRLYPAISELATT